MGTAGQQLNRVWVLLTTQCLLFSRCVRLSHRCATVRCCIGKNSVRECDLIFCDIISILFGALLRPWICNSQCVNDNVVTVGRSLVWCRRIVDWENEVVVLKWFNLKSNRSSLCVWRRRRLHYTTSIISFPTRLVVVVVALNCSSSAVLVVAGTQSAIYSPSAIPFPTRKSCKLSVTLFQSPFSHLSPLPKWFLLQTVVRPVSEDSSERTCAQLRATRVPLHLKSFSLTQN